MIALHAHSTILLVSATRTINFEITFVPPNGPMRNNLFTSTIFTVLNQFWALSRTAGHNYALIRTRL